MLHMMGKDKGYHNRGKHVAARVGMAFTRKPAALQGLLDSQTMAVGETRKIEVSNLVLVDLWLRVSL